MKKKKKKEIFYDLNQLKSITEGKRHPKVLKKIFKKELTFFQNMLRSDRKRRLVFNERKSKMKNERIRILAKVMEDIQSERFNISNYSKFSQTDIKTVLKLLKDFDIVKITPNNVRLVDKTNLSNRLKTIQNYF